MTTRGWFVVGDAPQHVGEPSLHVNATEFGCFD